MAGSMKRPRVGDHGAGGKRLRFTDDVGDKLLIVADALACARYRSNACQLMLESMVPGCLGSGLDERDDLQEKALEIMKEVMDSLKADVDADLKNKNSYVQEPAATDAMMKHEVSIAREVVARADDHMHDRERALEAAEEALDKARDALKAAEIAFADVEKRKRDKVQLAAEFEHAYTTHFVPLRDGTFATKIDADAHVQSLKRFFEKFDYADSLMSAFAPASRHKPADRKHFDVVTMTTAEKGFVDHKDGLHKEAAESAPMIDHARKVADRAKVSVEAAKQSVRDAGLQFGRAVTSVWRAKLKEATDIKALRDSPTSQNEAEKQLVESKQKHDRFMTETYEAFMWLKERIAILETRRARRARKF
eukprot:TRINITY_DN1664_c0_g2_i1.p1 TRINITY_DN1664_c0_g2~~TRINITY_DN1664_c0_g2_i1.p1  ORF type:complete len:377 (+),score=78.64 TRINITY_DN1664_c0_g2_i1:39-1133(+)